MAVELAGRAAATPTILCIDDNRAGLAIRKLLLEHQGYSVLTAEDGVSGLSLLERHPVDAVILDYRMPGMDGDAVAQIIRKEHPGLPIVILTGYPQNLAVLADAVITKGEPVQNLLAALEQLTGTKPDNTPIRILRAIEEARKLQEQVKAICFETRSATKQNLI